ncbi:MAG: hypothetical protein HY094_06795 [Candidatus Melainabacteria bacterium]|nr:hypothetical protein [Candidatus Melainabacteria bacterium]
MSNSSESFFSYSRIYFQGVAAPLASAYPLTGGTSDLFFGKVLPKNSSSIGDLFRRAMADNNCITADTMLGHYRTALSSERISQACFTANPCNKSLLSRLASFIKNSPVGKLFSTITRGIANIPILGRILSLGGGRLIPILSALIAFGDCFSDIDMAIGAYQQGYVGFWMKKAAINTTCTLIGSAIGFLCGGFLGAAIGAGFGNLIGNLLAPTRRVA